ncbi:MAG: hypothetical protein RJB39_23 [Candidatus Parcubacteria bacterium]|jgi:hypothetical protein
MYERFDVTTPVESGGGVEFSPESLESIHSECVKLKIRCIEIAHALALREQGHYTVHLTSPENIPRIRDVSTRLDRKITSSEDIFEITQALNELAPLLSSLDEKPVAGVRLDNGASWGALARSIKVSAECLMRIADEATEHAGAEMLVEISRKIGTDLAGKAVWLQRGAEILRQYEDRH